MQCAVYLRLFLRLGIAIVAVLGVCCCKGSTEVRSGHGTANRGARPNERASPIDGVRAIGIIEDIIALGPRHAGTVGAEKTRQYIIGQLRRFGLDPQRDDFTAFTPHPELKQVKMANITVDIPGKANKKVLIGGHFDGKILDGVDFKGANDGGSSTALLLELAQYFAAHTPPCPVRIAFFDGEEALVRWTDADSLYGSKHMATRLKQDQEVDGFAAAVVVDMIGDARLRIQQETLSTPWVFNTLARTAARLGFPDLFNGSRGAIADDHVPFIQIGIPAAVLIDMNFGPGWQSNAYWHTERDTVDKLSPKSIETVGHIVIASLPELARGQMTER
ncbi:MAG: M28 family peptidase [Myxococcota bacterium]|nr:M28 family peptidase [Myxococcota bacterium]